MALYRGACVAPIVAMVTLMLASAMRDSHENDIHLSVLGADGARGAEATDRAEAHLQKALNDHTFSIVMMLSPGLDLGFAPGGLGGPELIVGAIRDKGEIPENNGMADDEVVGHHNVRVGDIFTGVQPLGGKLLEGDADAIWQALTTTNGQVVISFKRHEEARAPTATVTSDSSTATMSGPDPDSNVKPSGKQSSPEEERQEDVFTVSIWKRPGFWDPRQSLGFNPKFVKLGVSVESLAAEGAFPDISKDAAGAENRRPDIHGVKIGDIITGVEINVVRQRGKIATSDLIEGTQGNFKAVLDAMTQPPPVSKEGGVEIVVHMKGERQKKQDVPGFPGFKMRWSNQRKRYKYWDDKDPSQQKWKWDHPYMVWGYEKWERRWSNSWQGYRYRGPGVSEQGKHPSELGVRRASFLESESPSASKAGATDHEEAVDDPLGAL